MINFTRCRLLAQVIKTVQQYQQVPYNFEVVPAIRDFILSSHLNLDEDHMFMISEYIQPRPGAHRKERPAELFEALSRFGSHRGGVAPAPTSFDLEFRRGYPFYVTDSPETIRVDENLKIKAATAVKLVEHLTHHQTPASDLLFPFLAAIRSFVAPEDLLKLVFERMNPPALKGGATTEALAQFEAEYALPVFLRSFNLLKLWLDRFREDFTPAMFDSLKTWTEKTTGRDAFRKAMSTHLQKTMAQSAAINSAVSANCLFDTNPASKAPLSDFSPIQVARQIDKMTRTLFAGLHVGDIIQNDVLAPGSVNRVRFMAFMKNLTLVCSFEIASHNLKGAEFVAALVFQLNLLRNFEATLAVANALEGTSLIAPEIDSALATRASLLQTIGTSSSSDFAATDVPPLLALSMMYASVSGKDMETSTMINVLKLQAQGSVLCAFKAMQFSSWSSVSASSYIYDNAAIAACLRFNMSSEASADSSRDSFRFSDAAVSSKDQLRLLLIGMLDSDSELRDHVKSVVKESIDVARERLRQDIRRSIRQALRIAEEPSPSSSAVEAASSAPQASGGFASTSASRQAAVRSLLTQLGKPSPNSSPAPPSSPNLSPPASPPRKPVLKELNDGAQVQVTNFVNSEFPGATWSQVRVPLLTRANAGDSNVPTVEVDTIFQVGIPGVSRDTVMFCAVKEHIGEDDVSLLLEIGKSFKMQNPTYDAALSCAILATSITENALAAARRVKIRYISLSQSAVASSSSLSPS